MASKTDQELVDYLIDIRDYTADEITAALEELQKRGKRYNDEQLIYFQAVIKRKKLEEDPDTPRYYSQQGINLFVILFSVIGGAILLSFNLKNRVEKWSVIGFGVTYFLFLRLVQTIHNDGLLILGLNAFSAVLLKYIFWNRYIGKDVFYLRKSLWIPLLITLVVLSPYIILVVYPNFMRGFSENWEKIR